MYIQYIAVSDTTHFDCVEFNSFVTEIVNGLIHNHNIQINLNIIVYFQRLSCNNVNFAALFFKHDNDVIVLNFYFNSDQLNIVDSEFRLGVR